MSDHYYDPVSREPRHWIEKKNGSGTRPTTIADARKNGWLPSVTTVLKCAAKPALTEWLCRNAATAALTTPRIDGEDLDAFLERIMRKDATDESEKARNLGTDIHDAIEKALTLPVYPESFRPYVVPVLSVIKPLGRVVWTERILIGEGYAGKSDVLFENDEAITLADFKSCSKVPDKIYSEHKLQIASYAQALGNTGDKRIRTAIVYISTKEPGLVKLLFHDDWQDTYSNGFVPILKFWSWLNSYTPAPAVANDLIP